MTDLAIYDMDKTVTRRPTYTPFLMHVALRTAPWRLLLLPFVAVSLLLYGAKAIDRARLKEINHRLLIGGKVDPARLAPHVESFSRITLQRNLRPGARAAIRRDKEEGRMLVLATASYRFYAEAIGKALGFDHVIGTEAVEDERQRLCARIDGENCYAAAKKRMVDAWLASAAIEPGTIAFYSDHHSDQPMFDMADEPVAVNPDETLRQRARKRGWRIEDWG
ncbi:HAD family hydrolase [Sphingomicrobium sediminis]|uniref:HAD-IB family hydrolase n=1 Tax=Sphingomicrobium sediminis TaxID=2950949 RepID=A0A9X2J516_9SPHN|nr:HAD-IB family hydrolase [Sphingomicrobium sediminis]MCM8557787.1 HAD-IB family hydrolase [Sphingomicrobium sediminis]